MILIVNTVYYAFVPEVLLSLHVLHSFGLYLGWAWFVAGCLFAIYLIIVVLASVWTDGVL